MEESPAELGPALPTGVRPEGREAFTGTKLGGGAERVGKGSNSFGGAGVEDAAATELLREDSVSKRGKKRNIKMRKKNWKKRKKKQEKNRRKVAKI